MPFTQFLTGVRLLQHQLAYRPAENPIGAELHLRPGSENIWVPTGKTVDRRPGIKESFVGFSNQFSVRHVVVAEDQSLAATVYHPVSTHYELWLKPVGLAWVKAVNTRRINESVSPHEMLWLGRKLYVKGNPTTDLFGSVVVDLDDGNAVNWWGLAGPSDAPVFTDSANWPAAPDDQVAPRIGARYAYTFVSATGHESSISPYTNHSGTLESIYPQMTLAAAPDTVNVPFFNLYRTGDGGGGLFFLEQIANTGAAIVHTDRRFPALSAGLTLDTGFSSGINTSRPAPGPTDNDPPPTVEVGTIGVDPIERFTPIVEWGGRIWFGVGKNLYFSVNDEAAPGSGLLQESFRGGSVLNPNRITFREAIVDLQTSTDGLYIFTAKNTFIVTGERRAEIRARILFPDIGIHNRHCSVAVGGAVVWLDQDLNLRSTSSGIEARGTIPDILSTPLNREQAANPGHHIRIDAHHVSDYLWVSIFVGRQTGTNLTPISQEDDTRVYVYDALRRFWFPPWRLAATTIWERFYVSKDAAIGQLDFDTYTDFGVTLPARLVISSTLIVGETNLNISDIDLVYQAVDGVELVWVGANLANQVHVGIDIFSGSPFNLLNYLQTTRGDTPGTTPVDMRRGSFWLPSDRGSGRYFGLTVLIPREDTRWSLLSAAFSFSSLSDSRPLPDAS